MDIITAATGFIIAIELVYYIFYMIGTCRVFSKCGVAGWKAIIPFYNLYTQYSLTWKGWLAIVSIALSIAGSVLANSGDTTLATISIVCNIAYGIIMLIGNIKLAKSFGHGVPFGLGLTFLQPIFIMILGFGSATYIGNTTEAA